MFEAYCLRCKQKRHMKDPHDETMKNGRPVVKGNCAHCGAGQNIIGKKIADLQHV